MRITEKIMLYKYRCVEKYFAGRFIDGGSTAIEQFLEKYIEEGEEKLKEVLLDNYKYLPIHKNEDPSPQESFMPADEEKMNYEVFV